MGRTVEVTVEDKKTKISFSFEVVVNKSDLEIAKIISSSLESRIDLKTKWNKIWFENPLKNIKNLEMVKKVYELIDRHELEKGRNEEMKSYCELFSIPLEDMKTYESYIKT